MARPLKFLPSLLYVILFYAFVYLPVSMLMLFSFQDGSLPIPPFKGPSLRWYAAIFEDPRLLEALRNSILVGVVSSLVAVVLGFLAAYGLARYKVRPAGVIQLVLIAPLNVSYLIIGLGLLILFNTIGVGKSLFAVGLGHVAINLPLCFAIIFSQMGDHQVNLEQAARDLGAGELQVLTRITVPLLRPAILASFFLSFTLSWDEFIIALLVSRFDVTLPVEIWGLLRTGLNPRTNAIGTLVFAVSVVIVIVAEFFVFGRKRDDRVTR